MRQSDRQLTTSRYNPTFEEWEDTELADLSGVLAWVAREHPGELVAAVKTLDGAKTRWWCNVLPHRGDMSDQRVHNLKCHPEFFRDVSEGRKTFEVRKDDRGFRVGDLLVLHEWPVEGATCEADKYYEACRRHEVFPTRVTYILRGGEFGIEPGHVVMGLDNAEPAP